MRPHDAQAHPDFNVRREAWKQKVRERKSTQASLAGKPTVSVRHLLPQILAIAQPIVANDLPRPMITRTTARKLSALPQPGAAATETVRDSIKESQPHAFDVFRERYLRANPGANHRKILRAWSLFRN